MLKCHIRLHGRDQETVQGGARFLAKTQFISVILHKEKKNITTGLYCCHVLAKPFLRGIHTAL